MPASLSSEPTSPPAPLPLILLLGGTGVGKSTFINALAPGSVVVNNSVSSCTQKCQAVEVPIYGDSKCILVDTPGFDDTNRTDVQILEIISKVLATQYIFHLEGRVELQTAFKGILYLHNIDSNVGSTAKNQLDLLQKICGKENLKHVFLATTRWPAGGCSKLAQREMELRQTFWEPFRACPGSKSPQRFFNTKDSALSILRLMIGEEKDARSNVVLQLQREMFESGMLANTTAGTAAHRIQVEEQEELRKLKMESCPTQEKAQRLRTLERSIERRNEDKLKLQRDIGTDVRRAVKNAEVEYAQNLHKKELKERGEKPDRFRIFQVILQFLGFGGITIIFKSEWTTGGWH